jgi:AcrR family transcriptional regulator
VPRTKTIEDEELLAIARDVLRKRGHTATIRDVAKAAKVSPGVLYQRFQDKDELFLAALGANVPLVAMEGMGEEDPKAFLEAFAAKVKDHLTVVMPSILLLSTHPRYSKTLMGELHRYNRAPEIAAMLVLRLKHWQKLGKADVANPGAFAAVFIHTLHSMVLREFFSGESKPRTAPHEMRAVVEAWWHGMHPR